MKKTLFLLLFALALPLGTGSASAADFSSFDDIDAMMEDNALTSAANRYGAVLLTFFPERATRLGYESANGKLDRRTQERDAQALSALQTVQESLNEVNRAKLSPSKQTDYDMLQAAVRLDARALQNGQITDNPLYYTQALDAVYDLSLKKLTASEQQDKDLTARAQAVADTVRQAQNNLREPSPYLSQLATEKAYYAYLAYDELADRMAANLQDDVSIAQVASDARAAKKNIKELFETFKKFAQETNAQDFRLGTEDYNFVLANKYFITDKKLGKTLEKNFKNAQKELKKALEPFAGATAADLDDQMVVISDLNAAPTLEAAPEEAPKPEPKKAKKGEELPPSAQDFYAVSRTLQTAAQDNRNLLTEFAQDAADLYGLFVQNGFLPAGLQTRVAIRQMPSYFAYTQGYFFLPPFGTQTTPGYDFFLRLPSGNALNKQAMLARDFNEPTRKLILTSQLIPGRYFQAALGKNASALRLSYPVPTLQNGWSVYAQHLAKEAGYIVTDQELLYLAWADYNRALAALLDYKLHTKNFSYADALNFLMQENGFDQEQAETLLKNIAAEPGEAVSYIAGYRAIDALRAKYQKKRGKKFSLSDFHAKLLSLGAIPPAALESEMENAYQREKDSVSLSSSLYL